MGRNGASALRPVVARVADQSPSRVRRAAASHQRNRADNIKPSDHLNPNYQDEPEAIPGRCLAPGSVAGKATACALPRPSRKPRRHAAESPYADPN